MIPTYAQDPWNRPVQVDIPDECDSPHCDELLNPGDAVTFEGLTMCPGCALEAAAETGAKFLSSNWTAEVWTVAEGEAAIEVLEASIARIRVRVQGVSGQRDR